MAVSSDRWFLRGRARRRLALALTVAFASIVCSSLLPHPAGAAISGCRTDPVITLTNLQTIDLFATINDTGSDVQRVVYVVHVPAGTSPVLTISYTIGFSGRETILLYANNPAGQYDSYTTVYTGTPKISVTASMAVSVLPLLGKKSASGYSGSAVHVRVSPTL